MNHAGEGKSDLITFYEIHQGKTAKILISNVKVNYQMFTFLVKCLLIRMNTCLKCVKLVLFFAAIFKSLTSDLDEFIMQVYVYLIDLNRGDIFVSQSGLFPCKAFFHVCGEKDSNLIEKLVGNIINQCENSGFESVAIPAICAGIFPLYWDSMTPNESITAVPLKQSSAEYKVVKEAFKRTSKQTVKKIERLQNIHLRRAYEAQKKHIAHKNAKLGGAGEKTLFHGTTHENCDSIMKTGFNRRFAGQNATAYGEGTYFAVNASYSAQSTYSKPDADGSQLMFAALVLTGVYDQGQSGIKVPPPRNAQQPHERYDSVVDNLNNPNMYVVFHDDQAYPDYLITFK
uniref:Poly [ADP-ribose] polymerase n=1 Tax=Oryzias latipes TaxID=8090 RepID=A0A3P9H4G9_ORYLA